ncbi:MAG: radical SAM protein [Candidatus Kaelpia imicola]|nr:radical SAM protein [Candidatus Kaelpia imicola]
MQEVDSSDISLKLLKKADKKRFPLRALFELTHKCNHKCSYCYIVPEPEKKELTTKEVFSILDGLYNMGTFYLGFTGGEIFMRPDIFDILFYAKNKGFEIILLTNGSLIDEKVADKIEKLSPNKVDITLRGATKKTFDKISGISGSFEKVYRAVDLLKMRSIPLGLKSIIIKPNIKEFLKMKELVENLGIIFRYDTFISHRSDGCKVPLNYRILPEEAENLRRKYYPQLFEKYDKDGKLRKKMGIKKNRKVLFNCGAGKTDVIISPYGEMKTCIDISYPKYNILNGSLEEGWSKIVDFVKNIKPGPDYKCNSCPLAKYCSWCPARGLLEEGRLDACSSYHRSYAMVLAKLEGDMRALKKAEKIFS